MYVCDEKLPGLHRLICYIVFVDADEPMDDAPANGVGAGVAKDGDEEEEGDEADDQEVGLSAPRPRPRRYYYGWSSPSLTALLAIPPPRKLKC